MTDERKKLKPVAKRRYGAGGRAVRIRTESNGLRPLKTVIIVLMIALQIGFLITLNVLFSLAFKVYLILSFTLSLLTCVYCLSSYGLCFYCSVSASVL